MCFQLFNLLYFKLLYVIPKIASNINSINIKTHIFFLLNYFHKTILFILNLKWKSKYL